MTRAGSGTLLSRSHISSMTGECTYPIYHQRVVNVENGMVLHHLVYADRHHASDALMLVTFTKKPVV